METVNVSLRSLHFWSKKGYEPCYKCYPETFKERDKILGLTSDVQAPHLEGVVMLPGASC